MVKAYRRRRDLTVELVRTVPGLTVVPPAGALTSSRTAASAWPRIRMGKYCAPTRTSCGTCRRGRVATVHGAAYGLSPHFRISFATSEKVLRNAIARIRPLAPTSAEHPANLARAITAQAAARPGLRLGTIDDQLTLRDALGFAARRARDLLDSGLRPGQRVAMVDSTSTDYLLTWLACVLAGTPVALVNRRIPRT